MNVYITKINGMSYRSSEQYAQQMTADIAHSLGIREMGIYRYNADGESAQNRARRLDGIIAGIGAGDFVICQFPTGNGLEFERALVRHIKTYHGRIVIFVHELEAVMDENRRSLLSDAVGLYNEAEVLIVPSAAMKRFLMEHGVRTGMRYIVQEMWDYTTSFMSLDSGKLKKELHFAGDPDGVCFPRIWDYEMPLYIYSDRDCQGSLVQKRGWLPPDRLLLEISKGGFGLVWYGNESRYQYLSVNSCFNLAVYLAAGIPVIVPKGLSNQCMIEQNHLGVAVDTLDEAVETVKNMTEQEYREYAAAAEGFAPLLRNGFFTKKCLIDAIQMCMRKDMRVYSESNEVYALPDCAFEYVCVNESFGDNLAVSWIFRGEAEGYLVYDADSGELVGEASHGLEHYLLLKNYPKETRFVVKAYVRAVRGKMIVAQSNAARVLKKQPVKALVSLIMPAYNAEEYIARSIDTALAQSFADMELIIVNDGSTDQTQKIIDWYQERYPQVKSVCQSNAGQASARNNGVEHAEGDYISYMDSDDMLRPDMIERLFDSIKKNECDISMSSAYQITNEGYEEVGAYSIKEDIPIAIEVFFEQYIRYAYSVVWGKLYKRNLVKAHPIPSVTYEDSAWIPYILSFAEKICYINEHLYEYDRTIRSTTAIHTSIAKPIEEQYINRRDYIMFFLKNGNPLKRDLLKRLALGFTLGYLNVFSYPKFKELKQEVEQMWN